MRVLIAVACLALACLSTVSADAACDALGGTTIVDGGRTTCFRVFNAANNVNANAAEAACQAWSAAAHLATIHSAAENAAISGAASALAGSDRDFWIGPTDAAVEGTYVNRDGSPFDFSNWAPGEPNDYPVNGYPDHEDCVLGNWNGQSYHDQKWNDYPCGAAYTPLYACSYSADALIPADNVAPCGCQSVSVSDPGTEVSLSFASSGATLSC